MSSKRKPPQITHTEMVAQSRIFRVEAVDLTFSNGTHTQYERLKGSSRGGVLIVPVMSDHTLLLVREYSVGRERYELQFAKGRLEAEEDILHGANREMQEELGYAANQLTLLKSVTLAPGYMANLTHIVVAQDLFESQLEGDEPEPLESIRWPLSKLNELVMHPEFTEGRSIAALYMVREFLSQQFTPEQLTAQVDYVAGAGS